MPWVLEIISDDRTGGEKVAVNEGVLTIGRQNCDIMLNDLKVSKHHCSIYLHGGELTIVDNSSTNGTYVNGRRVDKKEIHAGDVIIVGATNIKVVNV
ncbi:MAG: FHA domain-containing protein [Pseudomonadota bacterium]